MSGHSKWSKIKRAKGKDDVARGALFSKLSRAIGIAVISGKSGDASMNPTLRLAIEKARAANMPNVNVDRAIAKALSGNSGTGFVTATFEAYGPGGIALVIKAKTDNRKRTTAEIKNIIEKNEGTLGAPGSAMFMFTQASDGDLTAVTKIPVSDADKGKLTSLISSLEEHDDVILVARNNE
jgi:YebC/PmpR family DNA-binding regulatory protein